MKELEKDELEEIEGGIYWLIPIVIGVVLAGIVKDWPDFKQGIVDGLNSN
jgi:lactobin A/cerein 7B family class IIb bacteriocin